ncbi:mas-related G-protein coupled receptor member D [Octodon degus]|uniref:Mas-related G-protein coupled receptor member D n=1 Tax=Octodon degus TaxID=10160 RepID=A0A6P3ELH5_OCTDE|nr:mas-related G-protein coupled receptor member D [Octodon degus]
MEAVTWTYLAVIFLTMTTCVCGIAGNSTVVWLLSCRLRRTPFSMYVLNLAAADLLFLLCMACIVSLETQPMPDLDIANDRSKTFSLLAKAYEVTIRVKYFAYTTGLSLLTAISTQRCVSVLYPLWYKCHRPQHLSTVVSTLLWTLCFTVSMLSSYFCTTFSHSNKQHCFRVDVAISTLIMGVFTPMMAISSITLFVQVRKSNLLLRRRRRQPRRLYMVILASVFVFLVCSLPLGIYWFVLYWTSLEWKVKLLWLGLSRFFSSVSSSANPVIYFLVGRERHQKQESMRAVLDRALQEEPELEERETPSTGTQEGI